MGTLLSRAKTEEALCFSVSGTSEEEHSFTQGSHLSQLVEGQYCAFGLKDAVSGSLGKLECADLKSLRQVEETGVVGDGTHNGHDARVELGLAFSDGCSVVGEVPDNA